MTIPTNYPDANDPPEDKQPKKPKRRTPMTKQLYAAFMEGTDDLCLCDVGKTEQVPCIELRQNKSLGPFGCGQGDVEWKAITITIKEGA